MSTKHRNAGGPFTIFNPGLGVSGSLKIEQGDSEGHALNVSGSMNIMPKFLEGQGFGGNPSFRHMLEIAQDKQVDAVTPGGIIIHGANGRTGGGDGFGALGIYSGSDVSPREFVITSGVIGSGTAKTADLKFMTAGTDHETQRVKISQYPALQVTGSFQNNGNASITGSLTVSGELTLDASSGTLSMLGQPFDSLTNSADTTLSEGSSYNTVVWNATFGGAYIPSGNYDNSTGTYTAAKTGLYLIVLQVALKDVDANLMSRIQFKVDTTASSGAAIHDSCWINIIPQELNDVATPNTNSDAIVRNSSAMVSLNAGSTLKVVYRKTGGGNSTELLGGGIDGGGSFWQIRFMG